MPLFISEQAERDYYTLRRTMDLAQFKNDRPLIDWCERFLASRTTANWTLKT